LTARKREVLDLVAQSIGVTDRTQAAPWAQKNLTS
jgi:hypothetical protein